MIDKGLLLPAALCVMLSSCGGGSGVASNGTTAAPVSGGSETTPATGTASRPAGTPQSYSADAVTSKTEININGYVSALGNGKEQLTITYDPSNQTYQLTTSDRSQTFSTTATTAAPSGATRYSADDDLLTIYDKGVRSGTAYQYVTLGTWQRSSNAGTTQSTLFDLFTYGSPTAAASIPRAGRGRYGIDLLALLALGTDVGGVVAGTGGLSVDFVNGNFALDVSASQINVVSSTASSGYHFTGAGKLAGDGTFSGSMTFTGSSGSAIGGPLSGRFYGPAAQELAGTFASSITTDDRFVGTTSITGAITGQQSATAAIFNTSLLDIATQQVFATVSELTTGGSLTLNPDGSGIFDPKSPIEAIVSFAATDTTTGPNANFRYYGNQSGTFQQSPATNVPVTIGFYKTGTSNSELQLTYLNIAEVFRPPFSNPTSTDKSVRSYFYYGLPTSEGALLNRTGSAHYEGVAYGTAIASGSDAKYEISGKSNFDVNFGTSTIGASLVLRATDISQGGTIDIGSYAGNGRLGRNNASFAVDLYENGTFRANMNGLFFGPTAQEVGGSFNVFPDSARGLGASLFQGVFAARER